MCSTLDGDSDNCCILKASQKTMKIGCIWDAKDLDLTLRWIFKFPGQYWHSAFFQLILEYSKGKAPTTLCDSSCVVSTRVSLLYQNVFPYEVNSIFSHFYWLLLFPLQDKDHAHHPQSSITMDYENSGSHYFPYIHGSSQLEREWSTCGLTQDEKDWSLGLFCQGSWV